MEKGATRLDKGAHNLMDFYKSHKGDDLSGFTRVENYIAFYHESRLYSVYDRRLGVCILVYADSPYDAIERVMSGGPAFIQKGSNNYQIGHVGVLKI